jgi:hypothetical protein
MSYINRVSKIRRESRKLSSILFLFFGILLSFHFLWPNGLFAQDGHDIYFDNAENWLIMAYTEYNQTGGDYSVYLKVMDTNGTPVPPEDIKGLTENPHLIADNATRPNVGLAFDSVTGTTHVVYLITGGFTLTQIPDIVSTVITYSISGTVRTSEGSPISGVTITLSGDATSTVTTDTNGNYTFTGLVNCNYTGTPSKTGYTFSPASRPVTINDANVTGQDFTGAAGITYSISGTVKTASGTPIAGVTMNLSGGATGSTTTDSQGTYKFTGLSKGAYTIIPSKAGYTFTPTNRNVTIKSVNVTRQDFRETQ